MKLSLFRVLALTRRELLSLWVTPLAWVLLVAFLLLQGGIFYSIAVHYSFMTELSLDSGPLQAYFGQQSTLLSMTLLLICPAITMRSFAEERRSGTMETLLSAPLRSAELTFSKYLASLLTYLLIWSPTLLYVALLRDTGTVDWRATGTSYLGIALVGSSYLALGTLMSAMSRSQLIALILSVLVQFGIFVLGIGEYIFEPGLLREVSAHLSLTTLLEECSRGLVDTRRVILHGSLTLWALFVTTRVVESWRAQ